MYVLFLMVDANFRARCKDRGLSDTELGPGWAYHVEEGPYLDHVNAHRGEPEVRARSTSILYFSS